MTASVWIIPQGANRESKEMVWKGQLMPMALRLPLGRRHVPHPPGVICVRVLQRAWLVQSATLEYQKEAEGRVCLHSKNPVVVLKGGQSQIRKCCGDCVQCDRLCCLRRRRATLKW